MDNNLGWENFCTTSLYEDYEFCTCTKTKPTLQCQCQASVKGRYMYEQVGANYKLQPSHTAETPCVTNLFWNFTSVNASELYANWGAFVSTFIGRPYFRLPAIVIEPLFLNGIFQCDIYETYKQMLSEKIPEDTENYGTALRETWLATVGTISKLDSLNMDRAAPWLSFLCTRGCTNNFQFFEYFNDFRFIFGVHPPVVMLNNGFKTISSHEREFFPSLTCPLQNELDDLFEKIPKWDPRRDCNNIRGNPNTYPLLGINPPIQVELLDKRQGSTLTPCMRQFILVLHMPTSIYLACQYSDIKHWKRLWNIFKEMAINLTDLSQENWCTVQNFPPINSVLQYVSGGLYTLRKSHSIEKAFTHFKRNGTETNMYDEMRTPLNEMATFHQIKNHLIFDGQTDSEIPTTTNLANKQDRLSHKHFSIDLKTILTKQTPAEPNVVKLHPDFQNFRGLPRGPTGWPMENNETSWEFCARFFEPPLQQFSPYQKQHLDYKTAYGNTGAWVLRKLTILGELHPKEQQKLLHKCHRIIQATAPSFTEKEAEQMVVQLKKLFKETSMDPQTWKRALHSIICLLDRGPETQRWFLYFMTFYKCGVINTTKQSRKRALAWRNISPSKRIKTTNTET